MIPSRRKRKSGAYAGSKWARLTAQPRSDPRETVKAYEGRFPVFFFLQECNPAFRFFRRLDDDKVGRITERGFDRRAEFLVCVNGIGNSHVP